jgi:hypothetical protein
MEHRRETEIKLRAPDRKQVGKRLAQLWLFAFRNAAKKAKSQVIWSSRGTKPGTIAVG